MSDFDSDRFIIEFSEMDSLMKNKSGMFLISTVVKYVIKIRIVVIIIK